MKSERGLVKRLNAVARDWEERRHSGREALRHSDLSHAILREVAGAIDEAAHDPDTLFCTGGLHTADWLRAQAQESEE